MMKTALRTGSFLLTLLLLAEATACGSSGSPAETTASSGEMTTEAPVETEYALEKKDLGGYEFRIISGEKLSSGDSSWSADDIDADEENGDAINDAVYKRNTMVEEAYNIEISHVQVKFSDIPGKIRTDVMAGDKSYDAACAGISGCVSMASQSLSADMSKLDYLDFTRDWWDVNMMKSSELNGHIYFAVGDINMLDNNASWSCLFNKVLKDQYKDIPDLYEIVRSGKWTLDKLASYAKLAVRDLDGDSQMTWDKDQWGIIGQYRCAPALLAGSGNLPITKNKNGGLDYNLNSESVVSAFDRIYNFITDSDVMLLYDTTGKSWAESAQATFMGRRSLFFMTPITTSTMLRDMTDDFGILPFPKLDEKQENYTNIIQYNNGTAYMIPNSGIDADQSALILEALAYRSKTTLTPAYYDITLKRKGGRDDESSEMLDILFSSGLMDMSQAFSEIGIVDFVMNACKTPENNFVSSEAANRDAFKTKMNDLIKAFDEAAK